MDAYFGFQVVDHLSGGDAKGASNIKLLKIHVTKLKSMSNG